MRKSAVLHIVQPLPISILTGSPKGGHIENFSQILSSLYLRVGNNGIFFSVYIIFNPESST